MDVCGALTDSLDAGAYWRKLKQRLSEESNEVVTFCHGLKLEAVDGKKYETDCANTEGIFRIIQSIDSKGMPKLKNDARVGGQIAGSTRKQIEKKLGRSIVSKNNFLPKKKGELL